MEVNRGNNPKVYAQRSMHAHATHGHGAPAIAPRWDDTRIVEILVNDDGSLSLPVVPLSRSTIGERFVLRRICSTLAGRHHLDHRVEMRPEENWDRIAING